MRRIRCASQRCTGLADLASRSWCSTTSKSTERTAERYSGSSGIEGDDRARLHSNLRPPLWSFYRGGSGDGEGGRCGTGGQALVPGSRRAMAGGSRQCGHD